MHTVTTSEALFIAKNTTKKVVLHVVDSDDITQHLKPITVDELLGKIPGLHRIKMDDSCPLNLYVKFCKPLQVSHTITPDREVFAKRF